MCIFPNLEMRPATVSVLFCSDLPIKTIVSIWWYRIYTFIYTWLRMWWCFWTCQESSSFNKVKVKVIFQSSSSLKHRDCLFPPPELFSGQSGKAPPPDTSVMGKINWKDIWKRGRGLRERTNGFGDITGAEWVIISQYVCVRIDQGHSGGDTELRVLWSGDTWKTWAKKKKDWQPSSWETSRGTRMNSQFLSTLFPIDISINTHQ